MVFDLTMFINICFYIVIIGYFVYSLLKVGKNISRPLKVLKNLNRINCFQILDPLEARKQFINEYNEISKEIINCDHYDIAHQWREFEEQIIPPDGEKIHFYRNTQPPSDYFDEEGIVGANFTLRHIDSISAKLAGIGILGTFLGLSLGIHTAMSALNLDSESGSKALLEAIYDLLGNAGTAFSTSLVGLLFSMIFSHIEKSQYGKFSDSLHSMITALERCLEFYTVEMNNLKVLDESEKQTRLLGDLGNEISMAFDNAINRQLSVPMQNFSSTIESQLEAIKNANVESSKKISESMTEIVTGGSGGENFNRARESAHSALEALASTMRTSLEEMVDKQSQMSLIIESAMTTMSSHMDSGAQKYQDSINTSLQALTSSVEDLVDNLRNQLSQSIVEISEGVSKSQKSAFTSFENSTDKVGKLVTSLAERNIEFTDSVTEKTETTFKNVNNAFVETIGDMQNGFVDTLDSVNKSATIENQKITDSFNFHLEKLEGSVGQLNKGITEMGNSVTTFSDSIPLFKEPAEDLKSSFVNIRAISESLKQSVTICENLTKSGEKSSELGASTVAKLSETIIKSSELNSSLVDIWERYDSRFSDVDESMARVFTELNTGVGALSNQTTDHIGKLAEQLNKITGALTRAIDDISEAMDSRK